MATYVLDAPARLLFLSCDPEKVAAQLAGTVLARRQAEPLRDDVSTDEITPVPILTHFDEALGRYPYTGLRAGDALPVGPDAIRRAGVNVVVGGKRYGKGSSREHSPMAEKSAGVRLVIAESFERIYRQNADNIGLYTSTDMSLAERLRQGETSRWTKSSRIATTWPPPSSGQGGCWPSARPGWATLSRSPSPAIVRPAPCSRKSSCATCCAPP